MLIEERHYRTYLPVLGPRLTLASLYVQSKSACVHRMHLELVEL